MKVFTLLFILLTSCSSWHERSEPSVYGLPNQTPVINDEGHALAVELNWNTCKLAQEVSKCRPKVVATWSNIQGGRWVTWYEQDLIDLGLSEWTIVTTVNDKVVTIQRVTTKYQPPK